MGSTISWRSRSIERLPGSTLPELHELAQTLVAGLVSAGIQIAVAESCTAGALANSMAKAEGASEALFGGFVAYTAGAKSALLAVPSELIADHSAVSRPVARALATGVLAKTGVALALAVTGVTGASEDERGNPRGRVHIAAATANGHGFDCHCEFGSFPPAVLLDAALRTALSLGCEALAAIASSQASVRGGR